jgi:cytochrome c-type biogenesis protein CcmH/NrfG
MGLLKERMLLGVAALGLATTLLLAGVAYRTTLPRSGSAMPVPGAPAATALVAAAPTAPPMELMAARLAERLRSTGSSNGEDWTLLARAYVQLHRYGEAVAAFDRARELLGDRDAQRLADHAEAMIAARDGRFEAKARELVEAALRADPENGKALQLQALAADTPAGR